MNTPRRIALCLQYEGSAFCGWQRQRGQASVQATLEEALTALDPHRPMLCVAAGRTDSGVHAAAQVVHFEAVGPIPAQRWPKALNGRLPPTLRVRAAAEVRPDWHACFSAHYRRYRYTIYNGRTPNLFLAPFSWHLHQRHLNERAMAQALEGMLGYHDFAAFRKAGSRRSHSRTTIQAVHLERQGDQIIIEVQASGFLYGMVRFLVRQLALVGEEKLTPAAFEQRWRTRARQDVKEAAPPQGLCLLRVGYGEELFPKELWFDCQPRFVLASTDPPAASQGGGPHDELS
ncbi:tRNA pseudouridine(38-40) synthase TruA [Synechococcus sp. CS-1324]|uniref:tRNA pseudouridine(38-40) synthase TruA n=1 Tax=unclassified Synechococcus TaxID=2626047 RepID=UPI000DB6BEA2|nr:MULTISPECIES: tRNA pseudouridine(38-40) synthase TruA [unclassified Synechococcus]MCT0213758.1 tRNA pseudouridine(38-40) synthase TruA [Synechococcus sp. CS-1326]MCT0229284.1 tRNA pseudouridine(38-40) synthase TruA [Synechococcus sp. CS-1324]MCT0233788.1 tRNA pseudouridine(38-40) synthase TruA [Synechococcus sp. CS-1327]PZV06261.1 MAG: tRNA pseudouridine(38-40) synthase TruA [Cyanobium sp.]